MCLLKAIESLTNTVTFDFYLMRSLKVSDPRDGLAAQWYLKNLFFFPLSFPSTLLRMLNVTIRLITTYLLIALWLYLFESFRSRKIENRGKKRPSFLLEVKSFPEVLNILLLISQRSEIDQTSLWNNHRQRENDTTLLTQTPWFINWDQEPKW